MRYLLMTTLLLAGCSAAEDPAASKFKLNIDKSRVTVSGISAGAHMAHQLHIAYSDVFSGAGIVSGGPYNCADNSMNTALSRCMINTDNPLPVEDIAAGIREAATAGKLADVANLADDRVWFFHGTEDSKISVEVHGAAQALYAEFIPVEQMVSVNDVVTEHVFPTKGQGDGCMEMVSPYVGDCDYDTAGEMLAFLYPGLNEPSAGAETPLLEISLPGAADADLLETAYVFAPEACQGGDKACALHLVLHGCAQSAETVGMEFMELTGYLPWAAANNIIVAFPQVEPSLMAPLNPHGCWDWWGYTGEDYATRSGKQMVVLTNWLESLSK